MSLLWKILGIWSLADGVWLALAPRRWARFWLPLMVRASARRATALPIGLVEMGFGLYFIRLGGRGLAAPRRRRSRGVGRPWLTR